MYGDTRLHENLKSQIRSLFVGVVVNETSLIDYANTKRYLNYGGGYSFANLQKTQNNINEIKSKFPTIYMNFRRELMNKMFYARPHSFFSICDAYIKSFMSINYISEKELVLASDQFNHTMI